MSRQWSPSELGFIGDDKLIEGPLGILAGGSLPDLVQRRFGFRLNTLRHRIEHIAGFVHPAALLTGCGKHFLERGPETQGTIANAMQIMTDVGINANMEKLPAVDEYLSIYYLEGNMNYGTVEEV